MQEINLLQMGSDGFDERESRWLVLFHSPRPCFVIDSASMSLVFANSAFYLRLERKKSESFGEKFSLYFETSLYQKLVISIEEVLSSNKPVQINECRLDAKDLSYWNITIWKMAGLGQDSILVIEMTEVTEMVLSRERVLAMNQGLLIGSIDQHEIASVAKSLNQKMQEVSEAKNQFIAVMNHEIRTPLNAIIGFSDLILDFELNLEDRVEYSERIKRNGKILLYLIEDLLDLSKIEADRLELESKKVDLKDVFEDVQSMLTPIGLNKGLIMEWTLDPFLPKTILTDSTRFKQILMNLVGNAIKFTSQGYVKVSCSEILDKDRLQILVEDSGAGISIEHRERIFQAFAQADASITRRFGGTGLGLHLSRRIARAMGGEIELRESTVGIGSSFVVYLPLSFATYEEGDKEQSIERKKHDLSGIRVLLVEDAPDNQLLMTHVLRGTGCNLKVVGNGELAITEAFTAPYDIILMDIGMPVLDGISATRILRQRGYKGGIIALSAHAMKNEVEECLLAGCNAHVSKPFDFHQLIDTIVNLLRDTIREPSASNIVRSKLRDLSHLH